MNHFHGSALATSLMTFFLGAFVYFKKRDRVGQIFFLYSFSISLWSMFVFLHSPNLSQAQGWYYGRFLHLGAVMVPITFYHFVWVLFDGAGVTAKTFLKVGYVVALLFLALNFFTSGLVSGVSYSPEYSFPTPGTMYGLFFCYFVVFVFFALGLLCKVMVRGDTSSQRKQAAIIFYASIFGYLGGMDNFLITANIRLPLLYPYGAYAISIYVAVMTYAIIRYKLLDIEIIIKKTLVFAGLSFFVFACFSVPLFLLPTFFRNSVWERNGWWMLAVAGMLVAGLVGPLNQFLIEVTDKYLFQKKIDYQHLLRKASQGISRIRSLDQLSRLIVTFLTLRMRIENAAVLTRDAERPVFFLKTCRGYAKQKPGMDALVASGLVSMLEHEKRPIRYEDVLEKLQGKQNPNGIDYDVVKKEMNEIKASLVVPSFRGSVEELSKGTSSFKKSVELVHLLILGKKKSDEPYTEEDVDIFFTIAQESAVAIENARLYDEVIESREEALQAKRKTEEMELELIRREKFIFVEKLVRGIAHEINNPMGAAQMEIERLGSVLDQLRILREKVAAHLSEEDKELLDKQLDSQGYSIRLLTRTTAHITQVVDTLNQMQKADDGAMHDIDFKSYWATAVPLIEAQSHGDVFEQVPIRAEVQRGLPLIKANAAQLTQIFLNLYRNSLFVLKDQNNKKITLRAAPDSEDSRFLKIVFQDNGRGIPEDILPKIFDYMYTTKGAEGNGIGLNVCRTMVENFGGSITCESEEGKGAAFIIRLKCSTRESK